MKRVYAIEDWCIDCKRCEVACKEEHGYPVGKWGIRVLDENQVDSL